MRITLRWAARALCASLAVLLVSCGGLRTVYLPDGNKGYQIACKGVLNSWSSCLEKAGQLCGARGYNALRSEEYDRELMISCKNAAAH
jgi:hypothetical protein